MTNHNKSSLTSLHNRANALLDGLAAINNVAALQVNELRLLLAIIKEREMSTGGDFANVRSTIAAVEMVLVERGTWMTKQEIYERLNTGGFPMDPIKGKWLINDAINYHARKGRIVMGGDGDGMTQKVGLMHFTA